MGHRLVAALCCACLLVAGCSTESGVRAAGSKPVTPSGDGTPGTGGPAPDDPSQAGEAIPSDAEVTIERLDNGLTVYVRENHSPGGEVQLRLAVDVGSVLEDPDQSGVAHFLEHMLFNGTEHYPSNELVDTLQGFGMEFGADVNAYTSHDETVYELTVPTDDRQNLATGLDVLAEWLSAATLDADEVAKERGVVLDEWRQSDASFDGRVFDTIERLFLAGSAYEGRDPIGTDTAIEAMTPELLRRFYDRWYRPDNAAVIVVGDIDTDRVLDAVRQRFAPLGARGDSPPRPQITIAPSLDPAAAVLLDPDTVDGFVELTLPMTAADPSTVGAVGERTLLAIAFDTIANRISDDIARGVLPFTSVQVDSNSHVRPLDAPSILVDTSPEDARAALQSLTDEFERVHRFGFGAGEVARVVASYRSSLGSDHESADSAQDADFAAQYVANFLGGEAIPNADDEFDLLTGVLDAAGVDAVSAAFERRWAASAPHLLIVGPEGDETLIPTEAEALAIVTAASARSLEARDDEVFGAAGLMAAPEPVEEVSDDALPGEPGAFLQPRLLTFPNGARVILNPNEIADASIAFGATSPGGLSLVADDDIAAAQLMPEVMHASGLGELDSVQVEAVLADSSVEFQPYLDQTSENLAGGVATADAETLFQLLNLAFTAPRFDPVAFDNTVAGWRPYAEDPTRDPGLAASVAMSTARYGDLSRFRVVPTAAELDALSIETMQRLWRQRFGTAGDWVFVFSGDFDPDTLVGLARRYVGSLPGGGAVEEWTDLQPDPPATAVISEVAAGTGEQAGIQLLYTGTSDGGIGDVVLADALSIIASSRLVDHVREELGATYSPSAYVAVVTEPDIAVETFVEVSGDPDGIDRLSEVVRQDLAELQTDGPTDDDLAEAVAELGHDYQLFDNASLVELLLDAADSTTAIAEYLSRPQLLDDLTTASVAEFARRALPVDRYVEVRIRPA